jgi:hypothetical protein
LWQALQGSTVTVFFLPVFFPSRFISFNGGGSFGWRSLSGFASLGAELLMRHLEARCFENLKPVRSVAHKSKRLSVAGTLSG